MDIRQVLYPLGFLPTLLFSCRFFLQWWQSERKKRSVLTRSFWRLSLLGNVLLLIHSVIQVQYHVALIQGINTVIAKRNLELMGYHPKAGPTFWPFLWVAMGVTTVFYLQGIFLFGGSNWVQTPQLPWVSGPTEKLGLIWHILGFIGMLIFASRFWLQWWQAENKGASHLSLSFWWLSIIGATLSLIYFLRLHDPVNIVGYIGGLLPYIRNVQLLQKQKASA